MEISAPVSVSVSWIPEDDLLLRNAVEAGASLEALARGAIQFSRRYTLQQLRDRWHSLLYDCDIAAQASVRMFQLELSGFNSLSKFNRLENFKGTKDVYKKRKMDSIRKKYHTMRKKRRSEFFNSADLGFLEDPNLHDCNGDGTDFRQLVTLGAQTHDGNCISDDLGLQESDLDNLRNAFPEALGDMPVTSAIANSHIDYNRRCPNSVEDNNPDGILRKSRFPDDFATSLREERTNSFQPRIKAREIPDALEKSSIEPCVSQLLPNRKIFDIPERKQLSMCHSSSENCQNTSCGPCGFESGQHFHSPKSGALLGVRPCSTDFIFSSATSDGEFTDLPDSLLNLSNEDDILMMEVDGKDSVDKSCKNNLKLLPNSLSDIPEGGSYDHESEVVADPNTNFALPGDLNPVGSEATTSPVHGQDVRCESEVKVPTTSALNTDAKQLSDGNICCTLNMEDTVVPCNDDIFLLIHPSTSFASTTTQPIGQSSMDLSSAGTQNERKVNSLMRGKDSVKSFAWNHKVGPNILGETRSVQPAIGSTAKPKVFCATALPLLPVDADKCAGDTGQSRSLPANPKVSMDEVQGDDIVRVRGVRNTPATFVKMPQCESSSVKVAVTEPAINTSTSELEGPHSDEDVPYFSDVEAVILETDLDPHDQDSYTTRQVSRYQFEKSKRTIIRLEQCARSCLERTMTSQGAFAILYGRNLRHYIRKTEVTLGRSTDDVEVDIDLRKEGRANKISRRQAIIKMESGGFCLKNIGKCSITVNGKSVDTGQSLNLSSRCLIEMQGMSFAFEVNHKYVRQYMNSTSLNKGSLNKFKWSPEGKP